MQNKTKEENIDTEPRLYELGFHIVPIVSEEDMPAEFTKLKDAVESYGGAVVQSEMPKMIQLAYRIPKVLANKRTYYDSAYFGWIRFHMLPADALSLHGEVKKNEKVLRFIIVKAEIEKAVPGSSARMTFLGSKKAAETKETKEEKPEGMSEAEIDKTIEELMVN